MCLDSRWFDKKAERKEAWDKHGLSQEEAEEGLAYYSSTVYPIAIEIGQYISANWNKEQIALLNSKSQKILKQIHYCHVINDLPYTGVDEPEMISKKYGRLNEE